jgi:hypothetical protein
MTSGRKKLPPGEKVVKLCVSLQPNQLSKIRAFQIKYMQRHDTTLSFSKVLGIVIKNGLKTTKQRDLEK